MTDFSKMPTDELLAIALGQKPVNVVDKTIPTPEAPSAAVRLGRGMMDVYQGAKQKYLNWTDPAAAQQYTQDVNKEIATYEAGRQAGVPQTLPQLVTGQRDKPGFDAMRMAGAVATPLALFPGGGQSMLARLGLGAVSGGATGYTMFNPDNTENSNALATAGGAAVGGVVNAAAPAVVDAAIKGGQWVKNKVSEGFSTVANAMTAKTELINNVKVTLQQSGIDWAGLPTALQQGILKDAQEQLAVTGKLNPEQLARKVDIESVAGKGMFTKGQVTRDPAQWTLERNLQKTEMNTPAVQQGRVPSITNRLSTQAQGMDNYAADVENMIYGAGKQGRYTPPDMRSTTPLQASEKAIGAVKAYDKDLENSVNGLYTAYRQSGNQTLKVNGAKVGAALDNVLEDIGEENIPSAVMSRLRQLGFLDGKAQRELTIQEADKLNRLINNNNPGFGPQSLALKKIKDSLTEALLDVPAGGSRQLMAARDAAAQRFASQRAGVGIEKALDGVAPDRFFEQNVLRGNVRDVQALADRLTKQSPQAWDDLRAQAWRWAVDKARTNDGINGKRLGDALDSIGLDRLRVLFTPDELAKINTLRRGSVAMTQEPAFAAPNRSNTTPALMGELMRLGNRVPFLNMVTKPIEQEIQNSQTVNLINGALNGRGLNTAARDAADAQLRGILNDVITGSGYPGVLAPAAYQQYRK